MGDRLSELLARTADLAGPERSAPTAAEFCTRRITRRRSGFGVIATVVVVALVAVLAVSLNRHGPKHRASGGTSASIPRPGLPAPTGSVGVEQLKSYHWRTMPTAPIAARSDSAYAWTGSQLLVWGGGSGATTYRDGAAYDPRTRRWQTLPRSPLSARQDSAFTWTGHGLFVWGGNGSGIDASPLNDGALYDPTTRRWHRLPTVDVRPTTTAEAVWTGSRVVLFTVTPALHPNTIEVHAYDPATDRWTAAQSVTVPQTEIMTMTTVVSGDQLWLWATVQTLQPPGLTIGHDAYRYDPTANAWRTSALLPIDRPFDVRGPIWTGDHIFFAPGNLECTCGGPATQNTYGTWADPATGATEKMPSWSQFDTFAAYVWTGAAIVGMGYAAAGLPPSAWDPDTNRWSSLPLPNHNGDAAAVWTGTEILWWGSPGSEFVR